MTTATTTTPAWLTPREAARYAGISTTTIWRLARRGRLRPARLGGRVLYAREDIDALLRAAQRSPQPVSATHARTEESR